MQRPAYHFSSLFTILMLLASLYSWTTTANMQQVGDSAHLPARFTGSLDPAGPTSTHAASAALTLPASPTNLSAVWTRIIPPHSPGGRFEAAMAYDSHRNVIVLFGGDSTGATRNNDTWEFYGTDWVQINTPTRPPGRTNIIRGMVYDAARRRMVLFGGLGQSSYLRDTWDDVNDRPGATLPLSKGGEQRQTRLRHGQGEIGESYDHQFVSLALIII